MSSDSDVHLVIIIVHLVSRENAFTSSDSNEHVVSSDSDDISTDNDLHLVILVCLVSSDGDIHLVMIMVDLVIGMYT